MVLGGAPDGDSEVPEAKTISDKGSPHSVEYNLVSESDINFRLRNLLN